jgi:uncharacterized membrane protein (UPF0127 family)
MAKSRFSKEKFIPVAIVVAVAVVVAVALAAGGSDKSKKTAINVPNLPCGQYRSDKEVKIGSQIIHAEIPRDTKAQLQGLGGRPCILPNQGMLFISSTPGRLPIWMKDMQFPIDVVWITADRKVAAIEVDFQPSTYPEVRGSQIPAKYVLELKSNRSRELHMDIGTSVDF